MEFITCLGEVGACLLLCSSQPTSGGGCGKLAINSKLVVERTTARPLLPTSAELIFSKNITHLAHNERIVRLWRQKTTNRTMVNNDNNDDGAILSRLVSDLASSRTDVLPPRKRSALIEEAKTLLSDSSSNRKVLAGSSNGTDGRSDTFSTLFTLF